MSKANQTFKQNDEAVSPVIGVILMVAITVVLAAVVFVLVSNLGEGAEDAPEMGFSKDNDDGSVTVVRAPSGGDALDWVDDIALGGTCTATLNGAAFPTATGANPVAAGDVLGGCAAGETLTVTHTGSNTLLYETDFS